MVQTTFKAGAKQYPQFEIGSIFTYHLPKRSLFCYLNSAWKFCFDWVQNVWFDNFEQETFVLHWFTSDEFLLYSSINSPYMPTYAPYLHCLAVSQCQQLMKGFANTNPLPREVILTAIGNSLVMQMHGFLFLCLPTSTCTGTRM